jgi:hypothetical protein
LYGVTVEVGTLNFGVFVGDGVFVGVAVWAETGTTTTTTRARRA